MPRGTNQEADDIAKRASRRLPQEPGVFEDQLFKPSTTPSLSSVVQPREELPQPPASGAPICGPASGARFLLTVEPQEGCWVTELRSYLTQGILPEKEEKRSMWRGMPQHTASGMESSTEGDRMMCPCAASPGGSSTIIK